MVKYLTMGSYLTNMVCSRCAHAPKFHFSLYRLQKNWSILAQAPDARAVWISQRLRWRRHSAVGPAPACRRGKARVAAQERFFMCSGERLRLRRRRAAHMKTLWLESAISGVFYIWNPPTLADSGHKKCSCRFHISKIGASILQIIVDIQQVGFSFALFDGVYHFARASLFLSRALPAFFFFIDYLFFFIIIYYTTCHRTAGQI